MRRALGSLALAALLFTGGCSALSVTMSQGPQPPFYDLQVTCERTGGWWRGDLIAGYCEYQAPGFL